MRHGAFATKPAQLAPFTSFSTSISSVIFSTAARLQDLVLPMCPEGVLKKKVHVELATPCVKEEGVPVLGSLHCTHRDTDGIGVDVKLVMECF